LEQALLVLFANEVNTFVSGVMVEQMLLAPVAATVYVEVLSKIV